MIPVSRCKNYGRLSESQAEALLAPYLPEEDHGARYAVRDIFIENFDSYIQKHPVPYHSEKIIRAMMACGTGKLGYSLYICPKCQKIQMIADKCGSRYCTACGYLRQLCWVEQRKSEVIEDIPYYHIVFTVPHELNSLIFQNQKLLLDNLFHSAGNTILQLSSERKKIVPGIIMVLHTFSSAMELHYHIHMLVSGGGLTLDKTGFLPCRAKFFLPVQAVAARYRSLFLQGLEELHDAGRLEYFNGALKYRNSYEWKELLDTCYSKGWNVGMKYLAPLSRSKKDPCIDPVEMFSRYTDRGQITPERILEPPQKEQAVGSADAEEVSDVLDYFAAYSNRQAVTDNRIRSRDEHTVSFEYKDYRSGGKKKVMTLSTEEFMRRFLLHILPEGFSKIRYAGFLAGCVRKKYLALIRELMKQDVPESEIKGMTAAQLVKHFYGADLSVCQKCRTKLLGMGHRLPPQAALEKITSIVPRAS